MPLSLSNEPECLAKVAGAKAEGRTIRSEHQHLQDGDAYRRKVDALVAAARRQAQADRETARASAEEVAAGEEVRRALDELRQEKETKRDDVDRTPDSRRTPETLESDRPLDTMVGSLIFEAEVTPPTPEERIAEAKVRAAQEETRQALMLRAVQRWMNADAATLNILDMEDGESEQGSRFNLDQLSVGTPSMRSVAEETNRTGCSFSTWSSGCSSLRTRDDRDNWDTLDWDNLDTLDMIFHTITKKARDVMRGACGVLLEVRQKVDADAITANILDKMIEEIEGREQGPEVEHDCSLPPSATSFVPGNPSACTLIQSMFMDKKTADVVFEVREEEGESTIRKTTETSSVTFYAHRVILQKCSTEMVKLCGAEGETVPILITDIRPEIFRLLLGDMYGQKLADAVLKAKARELIDAADKYGVGHLKLAAEACFVESTPTSIDNMMEHLLYADAKNCALLKEAAMDFFAQNKVEVLKKVSLKDLPEGLFTGMLAAMARREGASGNDAGIARDQLCTMRVSDLRRKVYEKGLNVDGSRDMLIAALEESS